MMINIGGYVFGYDEEKNDIICFKNRRVRYETEAPDEYIESMLEPDDLAEGFVI